MTGIGSWRSGARRRPRRWSGFSKILCGDGLATTGQPGTVVPPLVVGGIFDAVIIAQVWKRPQIAGYLYGEGLHAWRTIGPWHREMNREGAGRSVGVRRCGAVCGNAIAKIPQIAGRR